jgi:hypothetical protein
VNEGTEFIVDKRTRNQAVSNSVIWGVSIRGWIVLIVVLTVCTMSLAGIVVIEPLYSLAWVTVGYYFGQNSKTNPTAEKPKENQTV